MQKITGLSGLILVGLTIIGCGDSGPPIASVEGTVTMDGKPLQDASIVFSPPGGRPAGAATDAEGKYELNFSGGRKGAIPGKNIVRISTAAGPMEGIPAKPETVPMEYNVATTLSFDVVDGEKNIANFDLKSGGRIATDSDAY